MGVGDSGLQMDGTGERALPADADGEGGGGMHGDALSFEMAWNMDFFFRSIGDHAGSFGRPPAFHPWLGGGRIEFVGQIIQRHGRLLSETEAVEPRGQAGGGYAELGGEGGSIWRRFCGGGLRGGGEAGGGRREGIVAAIDQRSHPWAHVAQRHIWLPGDDETWVFPQGDVIFRAVAGIAGGEVDDDLGGGRRGGEFEADFLAGLQRIDRHHPWLDVAHRLKPGQGWLPSRDLSGGFAGWTCAP